MSIDGSGGATGLAFYTDTPGEYIQTVSLSSSVDFAIGEFGVGVEVAEPWPVRTVGFDIYNQGRASSSASTVRAYLSDRSSVAVLPLGTGKDVELEVALTPALSESCSGNCTPGLASGASSHYTTSFAVPPSFGRLEKDPASPNAAVANEDGSFTVTATAGNPSRVSFRFGRYLWVAADTGGTAGQSLSELRANDRQKILVDVPAPTFADLDHLSAGFACNAGGSGNGTPRLEVHFDGHGVLGIRLGSSGFSEPCETLTSFSGVNVIGDTTPGRFDTSGLTGVAGTLSSSANWSDALALAGPLTISRIDFVATDAGLEGRSYTLNSIDVAPPAP